MKVASYEVIAGALVFMLAVTLHELAHHIYLKWRKIDYDSGLDDKGFFCRIKNIGASNIILCAWFGILGGLIPFIFYHNFVVLCLYLGGSFHDYKAIIANLIRGLK